MEKRGRRDVVIILILMIIIAAVIGSWLTGLWSCEMGRKDLTEQDKLTIADYINSISVLVQHSNKVSINYFTTLNKIRDITTAELDSNLSKAIEESKVIFENNSEMNPPQYFEVTHGYLNLVFETRNSAYEEFKPALFNVLADLDAENSSKQISNAFLYMYMSDEIYKYFQEELKKSGEKLGIGNLTIIDSAILSNKDLLNSLAVASLIADYKAVTNLQERRGVAVIPGSIRYYPEQINEQDEHFIIKKGNEVSVAINIENQGNVSENDVPVKAVYTVEGISKSENREQVIELINPSEQKTVTFTGFTAYPGKRCQIKIDAGPVENEAILANNSYTFKFMMEN
ncbi:MAG: hypothetical protein FJW68_05160 [Actinobacteria bacterium]|nr:hypothetical protein [Actinomycetota bacterium]